MDLSNCEELLPLFVWQICDFGLAKWKDYSKTHTDSQSRRAGTVTHTPPEIWKDLNRPRTVKYDVYSFAILLWELLTEEQPFKNGISHSCILSFFFLGCDLNTRDCYCIMFSVYPIPRSVKGHTHTHIFSAVNPHYFWPLR